MTTAKPTANPITEFKGRVEAFLSRTGMSERQFGKGSCNDTSFVSDLRAGTREPRFSTIEKIDAWMAAWEAEHAAPGKPGHGREPAHAR